VNGVSQESEEGISKVVSDFYSDLFQSSQPSEADIHRASRDISSKLTNEMSAALCMSFNAEDIRTGCVQSWANKSSRA
jgi:hypothetical protein